MPSFRLFGRFFPAPHFWASLTLSLPLACGSAAPGTIGAALGQRTDHHVFVRSLPPGQAAERAGLLVDDEILAIDGKDVQTMGELEIRKAVRGDVGTTMTVRIVRAGIEKPLDVKVTRTPLLADKPK